MTHASEHDVSRRQVLQLMGASVGGLALAGHRRGLLQVASDMRQELPSFTGPGPNPYWNSVGPFVTEPQKVPLIRLTD
ncbi:MAG TPA: hypothetical protein VM736_01430, partial [Gemmatimonadales bacterium]|nr:hypothetical protein [Gemmatimonadales bacterium]